jgi:16S rRNA (cytidine1402-2'-O)-methyltransferase
MIPTSTVDVEALQRPALYVVATPLGNLGDMTMRAVAVLRAVDLIAAEDTRHSARLLQHFDIRTPMQAYHDFSAPQREQALLERVQQGQAVALISDAGTPLISDPGYSLVRRARSMGLPVVPVPGASALTAALSVSGLPSDRFLFAGFPPARQGARQRCFEALREESGTLIFYESPHRIEASVADMCSVFGAEREAVICRELTKTWETVHGGSLAALCDWLAADANQRRGEFVVLVQGHQVDARSEIDAETERILRLLLPALPLRQAAALTADITGVRKNLLYQFAISLRDGDAEQE